MAMLAVLCGVVAFGIYGQAAESHALDSRVAILTQQNADLQKQISDRQREIVDAQTAAWLVEEARKLGYVFPGEKVFVITPPGTGGPASGGVNAPLPSLKPSPTPTPATSPSASPNPSPTPFQFTVGSPSPTPH